MIKRTIDISEQAYLHIKNSQLCVDKQGKNVASIAIEDLGILILQHPAIVITQSVITQCQKNNAAILFCDERHLPISINLPLSGHSLHTKVLRDQISAKEPTRKRLWQQIVVHKIHQQAITIEQAGRSPKFFYRLMDRVKSGDPDNYEAQAARQYWRLLMGENFRRNPYSDGANSLLNYGYTIFRAMAARALVRTGLHPALGLFHKNQYNGLCLADDVMEPFRPWVDWQVYQLIQRGINPAVTRETKEVMLQMLGEDVLFDSRKTPLMVAAQSVAAKLKQALIEKNQTLTYPHRISF